MELDVGEGAGFRRCPVQCVREGSPRRRESVAFAPVPDGSSGPLALLRVCHDPKLQRVGAEPVVWIGVKCSEEQWVKIRQCT